MLGHAFSSGFNLISFLLGQIEKAVCNLHVANPHASRFESAIVGAKPPESAFDKIHGATGPISGLTDSQPQQAHPQNRSRPFVPPRAVPPSNSFQLRERDVQRQPDHTSGGTTVPAGGRYRSPSSPPSCTYLSESNTLPRISPTLNPSGHCFNCSMMGSFVLARP